jgi:hypothetical protein
MGLKKRILLPVLISFIVFSIAFAGQITDSPREIVFYEDNNEFRMGNGVIGIVAYKNKGLEQAKPTYFDSWEFTESKANEEIYLEELANSGWKKVNFAHYSISMNEEEHTITKHYWNNIQESLDIIYYLNDFNSSTKLSFKLWGFNGIYRIQWRLSEINTEQIIENGYENYYVDEAIEQEPMSSNPIVIDPPEPNIPENYELKIEYDDLIESIGNEKVYVETEYNEDGTVQATNFILGDFSMHFWETLELDPQITSGHTVHIVASSILKDSNNTYWITASGDWESGVDDGGFALKTTNFSNASSWTMAVEFPNGGGDQNFMFESPDNYLYFVWQDGYNQEAKNSSDGTTWSVAYTPLTQAFAGTGVTSPRWVTTNTGIVFWDVFGSSDIHYVSRFNYTTDAWNNHGALEQSSKGGNVYFDEDTNYSYDVITNLGASPNVTSVRYSSNSFVSSATATILTNDGIDGQILGYENDMYLIYRNYIIDDLRYLICNSTEKVSGCDASEWNGSETYTIPKQIRNVSLLGGGTQAIDNEGIFLFLSWDLANYTGYYIFNNNTWFLVDDLNLNVNSSNNGWVFLKTWYEPSTSKILMAYSSDVSGYLELFTNEYELPDLVIQLVESSSNDVITTNQTLNVYCDGSTFMKQVNTSTGSIAVYPADYSGCSTNSTTIQLTQNDYQETNLTVTRDSNLDGYNLTADEVGWNISLNKLGCPAEIISGWDLFANNGTKNYTFTNQSSPTAYTIGDIDLTGTINFTFHSAGDDGYSVYDGTQVISTAYATSYELYTYHDNTDYLRDKIQFEANGTCCSVRVFWEDGTATSYSNSSTTTIWTNKTVTPATNKIARMIHFSSTDQNASIRGKWFNFSKEYENNTITTSRPTSTLTSINESMNPYFYYWAVDKRNTPSFRTGLPINISAFWMSYANATFTNTSQATLWNITKLSTELPYGTATFTFFPAEYNNSIHQKTMSCNTGGITAFMEQAGLQLQVFDESTLSALTFNVTIYNSTDSVTFTGQTNPMWKNYTQIPTGDITIVVNNASGGYEQRNYVESMSSTTFLNLSAYLLNNNQGLIRNFHVVDTTTAPLPDAIVKIYRFIGGDWTVVSSKYTDDSGTSAFLMNPSEPYQVVAWYYYGTSWISSPTYSVTPSLSDYTITISISVGGAFKNIFDTVVYRIEPSGFALPRTNSTTINFTVSCTSSDLEWFAYNLTDQNGTYLTSGNMTTATGGKLTATIDTTNLTKVYGTFYINRAGFSTYSMTKNFIVYDYGYGNYSFFAFLLNTKNDSSIPDFAKQIVVIFVTIGIMAGMMTLGIGAFGSALVGMAFITITAVFNWFSFPAMIVMWLALIGYLVLMRGYG